VREKFENKNVIEQGFTLIELLVVIAILGILAAVVVFAVGGITDRGKSSACKSEVSTVQTAIEAFYAKNGVYPAGTTTAALNTAIGPNSATDKFLNSDITANSPSVKDGGYAYTGGGVYAPVAPATGCP
jgi:prepilin-type N-terminal cleavage/methylation domain-containing protein